MAEAIWAKVLQAVYESEDTGWRQSLGDSDGLSDEQISDGLSFLDRHDLITGPDDPVLTEKGFDVARQREMQRAQFEMNLFLAVFTFVLTLAIVLQAVYQLQSLGTIGHAAGGLLLVATFVLLYLLDRRTGVMELILDGR
jgi:hypothetical protein